MSTLKLDGGVRDEFLVIMGTLGVAFDKKLAEDRVRVYAKALDDLPMDEVRRAADRAIKECQFFPTVADLRRLAEGTVDDQGLLAWTEFLSAAGTVGAYRRVVTELCAGQALLAVFGSWAGFCEQAVDGPELAHRRQAFLAEYRHWVRKVGNDDNDRLVLPGLGSSESEPAARVAISGDRPDRPALPARGTDGD